MRVRLTSLLVAGVAVAGTGCGTSEGGETEESKAATAVETYLSALAAGDGDEACDQLSGNGQRELVGFISNQLPEIGTIDCAEVISRLNGLMGPDEEAVLEDAEVTEVEIRGGSATATVEGANVQPTLIKSGDTWLIESGLSGP